MRTYGRSGVSAAGTRHLGWWRTASITALVLATSLAGWLGIALWSLAELPRYRLELSGGPDFARSTVAEGGSPLLGRDGFLSVVLRPASAVLGPVTADVLVAEGTSAREWVKWPVRFEDRGAGALRLQGSINRLLGPAAGRRRVRFEVRRPWQSSDPTGSRAAGRLLEAELHID